ncbi:hypothetical protein LMIY3S_00549 [Labrys miyagiensis]
MSPGGEKGNGDNLEMIEGQRVATAYAINALQLFDHLHFRSAMRAAPTPTELTLAKSPLPGGDSAWFQRFYVEGPPAVLSLIGAVGAACPFTDAVGVPAA